MIGGGSVQWLRRVRPRPGERSARARLIVLAIGGCLGVLLVTAAAAAASPPVNTKPPTISGTYKEGRVLTAKEGTWSGTVESFTFVWQRCTAVNVCANIETSGHGLATGTEYTLTAQDVGYTLRVLVTAHNSAGNGEAYSAQTPEIAGIPPKKEELPVISGKAEDGQLLSVSNGTWSGTPATKYSYLWESCAKKECKAAAGHDTEASYRVVTSQEEAKETLRAVVTDETRAGNASATSVATAVVTAGPPVSIAPPTISGEAREGQTLSASAGTWVGTPTIAYTYRWLSCTSLENCALVGAGTSYTPGALELGDTLEVEVTAKNSVEPPASAISAKTLPVVGNPPVNTKLPTVSGEAREGQTLSASPGTWTGTEPITYEYEWKSCNAKSECTEKAGSTYLLAVADVGNTLRVLVTARNAAGSASATSAATVTVVGNPPVNTKLPVISGEAREGQTLSASPGAWTGTEPFAYEYEWRSCNAKSECVEKAGATYLLAGSDVGNKLEVVVKARNSVGTASATSAATVTVVGNPPVNTKLPVISGEAREGQTLSASAGAWTGTEPFAYEYEWRSCNAKSECVERAGATYLLAGSDVANKLEVVVKARNSVGSASATSAATVTVVGNPPVNTKPPTISGEAREGQTLSASAGAWTGTEPFAYEYEWKSCNAKSECKEAGGDTYALMSTDVGRTVTVTVTATNAVGHSSATSAATAEVQAVLGTAAVAWGRNYPDEQLGAGYRDAYEFKPVSVVGVTGIAAVAAAGNDSYALLGDGTVRAWGSDVKGQLGDNVPHKPSGVPVTVLEEDDKALIGVSAIAASYGADTHAMGLVNDAEHEGEVATWGASEYGERGNGESGYYEHEGVKGERAKVRRDVAVMVPGLKHVVAIAAGADDDFALQEEGGTTTLWAWGEDTHGRLGLEPEGKGEAEECAGEGSHKPYGCRTTPTRVDLPSGVKVTSISAGKQAAYAVLSNGKVLAWGSNSFGELGNGSTTEGPIPEYVCATGTTKASCQEGKGKYLEKISTVAGGDGSVLALTEAGEVVGWGNNGSGQLGGESTEACAGNVNGCQEIPRAVAGLSGVTHISAGTGFSLALETNGDVYSFGESERGQLGDGVPSDPEKCVVKKREVEVPCNRKPTPINGLSDVGGISAGGGEKGEGHSLAFVLSGSGPLPLLSVTAAEKALRVTWRFSSFEDKIRWRPAALTSLKGEEAKAKLEEAEAELEGPQGLLKEAKESAEEDEAGAARDNENAKTKEENEKSSGKQKRERLEEEVAQLKKEAAQLEKAAGEENAVVKELEPVVTKLKEEVKQLQKEVNETEPKWSKTVTWSGSQAKECAELGHECELTINEYYAGVKELNPEPYEVEVNPNASEEESEAGEEESRGIVGTPLP
jgi:alpha-tubulin suppressor-like RCC1 family protein